MRVYYPEPRPNTRYYGRVRLVQHPDGYLYSQEAPYDEDYVAGTRGGLATAVVVRQGAPFCFTEAGRASKGHVKTKPLQKAQGGGARR